MQLNGCLMSSYVVWISLAMSFGMSFLNEIDFAHNKWQTTINSFSGVANSDPGIAQYMFTVDGGSLMFSFNSLWRSQFVWGKWHCSIGLAFGCDPLRHDWLCCAPIAIVFIPATLGCCMLLLVISMLSVDMRKPLIFKQSIASDLAFGYIPIWGVHELQDLTFLNSKSINHD